LLPVVAEDEMTIGETPDTKIAFADEFVVLRVLSGFVWLQSAAGVSWSRPCG
jgi:hypothetical protein